MKYLHQPRKYRLWGRAALEQCGGRGLPYRAGESAESRSCKKDWGLRREDLVLQRGALPVFTQWKYRTELQCQLLGLSTM